MGPNPTNAQQHPTLPPTTGTTPTDDPPFNQKRGFFFFFFFYFIWYFSQISIISLFHAPTDRGLCEIFICESQACKESWFLVSFPNGCELK
jgi:hypothetical protein